MDDTHQISRRRSDSSLDLSHISRTTRPSNLVSLPDSETEDADAGALPAPGSMSMDSPRHPAFWRFAGVGGDGLGVCGGRLARKSASYRARVARACFTPIDVGAMAEAREEVDVREVVVLCEKTEE